MNDDCLVTHAFHIRDKEEDGQDGQTIHPVHTRPPPQRGFGGVQVCTVSGPGEKNKTQWAQLIVLPARYLLLGLLLQLGFTHEIVQD